MKNITVTLEDDLYRDARIAAAQADTSVTGLVREFLTILTRGEAQETGNDDTTSSIMEAIDQIRKRHPEFDATFRLSREEAHARSN